MGAATRRRAHRPGHACPPPLVLNDQCERVGVGSFRLAQISNRGVGGASREAITDWHGGARERRGSPIEPVCPPLGEQLPVALAQRDGDGRRLPDP